MRKVFVISALIIMSISFTGCENESINDEITTIELQSVEPDDDGSVDEDDHRENP